MALGVLPVRVWEASSALSRYRDKASYAEVVIMPRWRAVPLVLAVAALGRSA
jgi:hypothetical protein